MSSSSSRSRSRDRDRHRSERDRAKYRFPGFHSPVRERRHSRSRDAKRSGGNYDNSKNQGYHMHATHSRKQDARYKNFFSQEPMSYPGVKYAGPPPFQPREPHHYIPAPRSIPAPDKKYQPREEVAVAPSRAKPSKDSKDSRTSVIFPEEVCQLSGTGLGKVTLRDGRMEDRSRDWLCKCGERNFMRRRDCWKCFARRPPGVCDEAGQDEWEKLCKSWSGGSKRGGSKRRHGKKRRRKKGKSSSGSSSGSSSEKSSASGRRAGDDREEDEGAEPEDPELEEAKSTALQRLVKIKEEPSENRMRSWRALLREWHPDKHENKKVATAVFQFLQKGKSLVMDN